MPRRCAPRNDRKCPFVIKADRRRTWLDDLAGDEGLRDLVITASLLDGAGLGENSLRQIIEQLARRYPAGDQSIKNVFRAVLGQLATNSFTVDIGRTILGALLTPAQGSV